MFGSYRNHVFVKGSTDNLRHVRMYVPYSCATQDIGYAAQTTVQILTCTVLWIQIRSDESVPDPDPKQSFRIRTRIRDRIRHFWHKNWTRSASLNLKWRWNSSMIIKNLEELWKSCCCTFMYILRFVSFFLGPCFWVGFGSWSWLWIKIKEANEIKCFIKKSATWFSV